MPSSFWQFASRSQSTYPVVDTQIVKPTVQSSPGSLLKQKKREEPAFTDRFYCLSFNGLKQ